MGAGVASPFLGGSMPAQPPNQLHLSVAVAAVRRWEGGGSGDSLALAAQSQKGEGGVQLLAQGHRGNCATAQHSPCQHPPMARKPPMHTPATEAVPQAYKSVQTLPCQPEQLVRERLQLLPEPGRHLLLPGLWQCAIPLLRR